MAEQHNQAEHNQPAGQATANRAIHLFLVAVIGIAFVGFFVGIRQGTPVSEPPEPERADRPRDPEAIPATSYVDFDRRTHGPNRDWSSVLGDLEQPDVDFFAMPQRTEAERRAVLAARAERRAYKGAPPTVPHPVDQMSAASCMACHGEGLQIGEVRASRMSHDFMTNCTQCHVEQQSPDLRSYTLADNHFQPLEEPLGGERAWHGAPPTIPHSTFMREDCLACHGPQGSEPIRTTHPWQTNCMQCHAPSAALDQAVYDDMPSFLEGLR